MPFLGSTTLEQVIRNLGAESPLPRTGAFLEECLQSSARVVAEQTPDQPGLAPAADTSRHREATLPLGPAEGFRNLSHVNAVLWLGARLADALACAHARGVVHRDLKPANILLSATGQPMLLDFNLAENLAAQKQDGAIGGTLAYMAPEQLAALRGGGSGTDPRSDLYALGIVLFELLAGRYPFSVAKEPSVQAVEQALADRQTPPSVRSFNPAVSSAVESILCRCLDPDPARRYQSATELQEDLERQRDDLPLRHAAEPSLWEQIGKWLRRQRTLAASLAGVAATLLVLLLSVLWTAGGRSCRPVLRPLAAVREACWVMPTPLDGPFHVKLLAQTLTDQAGSFPGPGGLLRLDQRGYAIPTSRLTVRACNVINTTAPSIKHR